VDAARSAGGAGASTAGRGAAQPRRRAAGAALREELGPEGRPARGVLLADQPGLHPAGRALRHRPEQRPGPEVHGGGEAPGGVRPAAGHAAAKVLHPRRDGARSRGADLPLLHGPAQDRRLRRDGEGGPGVGPARHRGWRVQPAGRDRHPAGRDPVRHRPVQPPGPALHAGGPVPGEVGSARLPARALRRHRARRLPLRRSPFPLAGSPGPSLHDGGRAGTGPAAHSRGAPAGFVGEQGLRARRLRRAGDRLLAPDVRSRGGGRRPLRPGLGEQPERPGPVLHPGGEVPFRPRQSGQRTRAVGAPSRDGDGQPGFPLRGGRGERADPEVGGAAPAGSDGQIR
jgi:hypothetical protein